MMKSFRHLQTQCPLRIKNLTGFVRIYVISNHSLTEPLLDPDPVSSHWCERALPKLIKLRYLLKGLDLINGRLINVQDKCVVTDEFLIQSMHNFKSIGRVFLLNNMHICVNKPIYREPVALNSLKKVSDILLLSAQQRKLVRLAICPQVTQHQIWIGALTEILNQLRYEMSVKDYECITNLSQQIVVNCLRFLDDAVSYDPDSTSWMRLTPKKDKDADSPPSATWTDLLEMFDDLIKCLKNDQEFLSYVIKLEAMKEGLLQIKDVLVDKNIGYKEARHQQSLVQKRLTKSLGHSSQCLFILLFYYLYGSIRDIEVDICCWVSEDVGGNKSCLCVGKILTSDGDKMVMRVVKQLDRVLGVIKFVYEMAEMKELLEVQGHIWCIGSESRSLVYRGRSFFIHGIGISL